MPVDPALSPARGCAQPELSAVISEERRHADRRQLATFVDVDPDRDVFAGETEARADVADSREIRALIRQKVVLPSVRREVRVDLARGCADWKVAP